jgi:hypothetical protein
LFFQEGSVIFFRKLSVQNVFANWLASHLANLLDLAMLMVVIGVSAALPAANWVPPIRATA